MSAAPVVIPPAGVYAIQNIENGRVYVGSSVDVLRRLRTHETQMLLGRSSNPGIQADLATMGCEAFVMHVLERVSVPAHLSTREQFWADYLRAFEVGYNVRRISTPAPAQVPA